MGIKRKAKVSNVIESVKASLQSRVKRPRMKENKRVIVEPVETEKDSAP
jgi:hypothetical protein